tara:strand:+ start:189 stop:518 length:330 start_codon:yes stop_codon:yes gene_type:complete
MPNTIRRIYQEPNETARHLKLKKACLDYFTAYDKLINRPSRRYAIEARRALRAMRKAAQQRATELLSLYSDHQNIGKEPLYGNHDKFSISLINKHNVKKEKEETNNART